MRGEGTVGGQPQNWGEGLFPTVPTNGDAREFFLMPEKTERSRTIRIMPQKIAYLDCHSGISGDMFLGAMLDTGLSLDTLKTSLASLPVVGYDLVVENIHDKGIRGSRLTVVTSEQEQSARNLSDISSILYASTLPAPVRDTSLAIFQRLADAEASVHGTSIEEVHFHEVGAIDALVDITGAAIAVESLGIIQLYASPLPLTSGHVNTAHG